MRYAAQTSVPVERSRAEIERIVSQYGADQFACGWDAGRAIIMFRCRERFVRFVLPIAPRDAEEFSHYRPGGGSFLRKRAPEAALAKWEQACRQRWRALALAIKAKLEAVDAGITSFEDEFLAHIVLPDGSTVAHWLHPQLEAAYTTGRMPQALPMLEGGRS